MGDDLSTGAKIGIGLVILCFLIAIVLSLLMVVKNITNSGASQMESGLGQMMSTTYDDYDQTVVSGTKVKAALKLFQGENMAIVIDSRFVDDGNHVYNYGLLLQSVAGSNVATSASYIEGDDGGKAYGKVYKVGTVTYGAASANIFNADGVSVKCTCADGAAQFNMNVKPTEASGKDTYVRDNAKYQAYLIKDSTDTIVGIYFTLAVS